LTLLGRSVAVGSIHAVATHPQFRRRGFYRELMEEVLQYSANRYETLILTTANPEYYEPFGFRPLQEHTFTLHRQAPGNAGGLRLLDLHDAVDVALMNRLLRTRTPVSQVVGVGDAAAVFHFNEARRPLHYVDDLDVMVCMEMDGGTLKLFDIVGPELPLLEALLARIPQPIEQVVAYFAPDRFAADATVTPYALDHDGPSYLMVRGPFAAEERPFTLPRSART
jgi:hypothetical protein